MGFQKYDNDKSGQIEKREFQDLLRELLHSRDPHDISKDRLDRFWADADHDKSSSINFSEFLVWYMRYRLLHPNQTLTTLHRWSQDTSFEHATHVADARWRI